MFSLYFKVTDLDMALLYKIKSGDSIVSGYALMVFSDSTTCHPERSRYTCPGRKCRGEYEILKAFIAIFAVKKRYAQPIGYGAPLVSISSKRALDLLDHRKFRSETTALTRQKPLVPSSPDLIHSQAANVITTHKRSNAFLLRVP